MANYEHIIWDWNGTLLDDAWLCHEISNQQLTTRGLPTVEREQFLKQFRVPIKEFLVELGLVNKNEHHGQVSQEFHGLYQARRHELELHSDTKEILDQVARMGLSQSILSAHPADMLDSIVRYFQIEEYFTSIIGHENVLVESKVEIGRSWLNSSGISPSSIVMVGDTEHDFEVAQALGVDCLLIPCGMQHRCRLEPLDATVLESLSDLIGHL